MRSCENPYNDLPLDLKKDIYFNFIKSINFTNLIGYKLPDIIGSKFGWKLIICFISIVICIANILDIIVVNPIKKHISDEINKSEE